MAKKRTFEEAKSLVKELNPDLELLEFHGSHEKAKINFVNNFNSIVGYVPTVSYSLNGSSGYIQQPRYCPICGGSLCTYFSCLCFCGNYFSLL